jgi:hypothetical protein
VAEFADTDSDEDADSVDAAGAGVVETTKGTKGTIAAVTNCERKYFVERKRSKLITCFDFGTVHSTSPI